jgi:transcriptional antiterminator RfaH
MAGSARPSAFAGVKIFDSFGRLGSGEAMHHPLTAAITAAADAPAQPPHVLADSERWFAVHTLPFAEMRAELQLRRQMFRTFQPKRHKTVRHARKLRNVEAPFFPRYLFVVLDLDRHQWRKVNGTFGVSRLVMRGERPHPVPAGVVEALIASADAHGILQLGRTLQIGDTVRMLAGPFAEQLAILDDMDDAGRVRVLLDILGRQVAVSTGCNDVIPVAELPA